MNRAYGYAADGLREVYSGSVQMYAFDPEGNVSQRGQGGYIRQWRDDWVFDSYGQQSFVSTVQGGGANPDVVGFAGQQGGYYDLDQRSNVMTHRWYDPGTGRFVNRDPLGYGGGLNVYGYAGGNPITHSDPSGLQDPVPEGPEEGEGDAPTVYHEIGPDPAEEERTERIKEAARNTCRPQYLDAFDTISMGMKVTEEQIDANSEVLSEMAQFARMWPRPANPKIFVIGEGMNRGVKDAASAYGANYYEAWNIEGTGPGGRWNTQEEALAMARNMRTIDDKIKEGYTIIDIGPEGPAPESEYYKAELKKISGYARVIRANRPAGPWLPKPE